MSELPLEPAELSTLSDRISAYRALIAKILDMPIEKRSEEIPRLDALLQSLNPDTL